MASPLLFGESLIPTPAQLDVLAPNGQHYQAYFEQVARQFAGKKSSLGEGQAHAEVLALACIWVCVGGLLADAPTTKHGESSMESPTDDGEVFLIVKDAFLKRGWTLEVLDAGHKCIWRFKPSPSFE